MLAGPLGRGAAMPDGPPIIMPEAPLIMGPPIIICPQPVEMSNPDYVKLRVCQTQSNCTGRIRYW